jgi:hypothetical protein
MCAEKCMRSLVGESEERNHSGEMSVDEQKILE